MTNITLSIPSELKKRMQKFSEVKWSEVARQSIKQRVEDLEIMNELTSKSKLTKKDIEKISKKIKRRAAKKLYGKSGD